MLWYPSFFKESCLNCAVSTTCQSCLINPEAKVDDIAKSATTKKKNDGNQGGDNQAENIAAGKVDEGNTDNESDKSHADESANECLNIGDTVWGKHGRVLHPVVVAALEDVPKIICQHLARNLQEKRIVKWWSENFSPLVEKSVEPLAPQNQDDEFKTNRSRLISRLYHQALAKTIIEDWLSGTYIDMILHWNIPLVF